MAESLTFTAVYETVENGWVQARLAEIPGVISAAPTREEAEEMLVDALREYLLSCTEPAEPTVRPAGAHITSGLVGVTFTAA